MPVVIFQMVHDDYAEALVLWQETPGIGLSNADSREGITGFLDKNPGLCFVARNNQKLVGTVLCGSDGRRGYIYHLAVREDERQKGTGRLLVENALNALKAQGIQKCHIFVYDDNQTGIHFWHNMGWVTRNELVIMSWDTNY